jgi:hypothetical protein
MDESLQALVSAHLEGTLDEEGARRLEEAVDPAALADQIQIHQRLGVAYRDADLPASVVRELKLQGDARRFSASVVARLKPRSRAWEIAAAALLLAGLFFFLSGRDATTPAARRGVLFVVGALPLQDGDRAVLERLESLAGPVRVVSADALGDSRGFRLVVVSSTTRARETPSVMGRLAAAIRGLDVPILTWEPRLYYDLGMIPGQVHQVDWATARGQTSIVVSPGPLSAGLSGSVTIASAPSQVSWARTRPDAIRVAVLEGDPERAAIFAVEKDVPGRRVGFFLFDETPTALTGAGWSLFDAAVQWSLR